MSDGFHTAIETLRGRPRSWLVTGVAGFIGSHLLQFLLKHEQRVVGLDNFATGAQRNLDLVRHEVGPDLWKNFTFQRGDIAERESCRVAVDQIDYVLHQAALGSVPRSISDPLRTNDANVTGFLNLLWCARESGVEKFIYAASSSTYGDHESTPKVEDRIGRPLSPYAVTKYVNELYAEVFGRCYDQHTIGLRYFNVFGPRQDPKGAYAAVIPRWINALIQGEPVHIFGDGETSRDFCYVANVVQANILAAMSSAASGEIFNVAVGDSTSLNSLYQLIYSNLESRGCPVSGSPVFKDFRAGDVRHSSADISKAQHTFGYRPAVAVKDGISATVDWFLNRRKVRT